MITQLSNVTAQLRPRADLVIDKLAFCRRIDRYGVYQTLDENHPIRPKDPVELYVEVEPDGTAHRIQVRRSLGQGTSRDESRKRLPRAA